MHAHLQMLAQVVTVRVKSFVRRGIMDLCAEGMYGLAFMKIIITIIYIIDSC